MPITRRSTRTNRSGTRRNTTKRSTSNRTSRTRRTSSATSFSPAKFNSYRRDITAKIGSFRNVNQQISGASQVTAFSPSTANRWINYINSGSYVFKFNSAQFGRIVGKPVNTNTAAFRALKSKFGAGIKAVTQGKGSNWLVAASNRVSARPFSNYTWT